MKTTPIRSFKEINIGDLIAFCEFGSGYGLHLRVVKVTHIETSTSFGSFRGTILNAFESREKLFAWKDINQCIRLENPVAAATKQRDSRGRFIKNAERSQTTRDHVPLLGA